VGLYFSDQSHAYSEFTPELVKIYNELVKKGEDFEIVFLSRDYEEKDFEDYYASMPWLTLPFADSTIKNLSRYFHAKMPSLIILGPDGKTLQTGDAVDLIMKYGIRAYPFTKERLDELRAVDAEDEAKREAQTLESVLVSDDRNFVIRHGGAQVSY
jgi:nucleoredoxin